MSNDVSGLQDALTRVVGPGGVDFSTTRRAEYSADASNYRRIPEGVVFPSNADELVAVVGLCRDHSVPITLRGAGTSTAGNAVGDGVVIDCSRHMNRIIEIDPQSRTARVEPGVVLDDLQKALAVHGLRFGPDPSTHSRCTIGGMIGNNSCGARSLMYGKTADNVLELEVVLYDGTRLQLTENFVPTTEREQELYNSLNALAASNASLIGERSGKFSRQISGYSLEHLAPETLDLAKVLVGTEGTCAVVLSATLHLVPLHAARALVVLGFDDLPSAADAVPALLPFAPTALEGMDRQVVQVFESQRASTGDLLPNGNAWLLVEFSGEDEGAVAGHIKSITDQLVEVSRAVGMKVATTPADQKLIWRIREDGAGLATRRADGTEAWPGWEDAAVPAEQLGIYVRGFQELMAKHQRKGAVYGHFGEGCIHTRIDFDFANTSGVEGFRAFVKEACELAARHGGSFSGEHGDGLARSEFLNIMYGEQMVSVFKQFKTIWDPQGMLNPGVIVDPDPMDSHLRVDPARKTIAVTTNFGFEHDDGDFAKAVRRCVGVGKCRNDSGGVMCPSFRATHDERDSTRGRARVLHEMLQGEVVTDGWQSQEALEALDLCLSCKGCKSDCPVNVDMATYKSEFLSHFYEGKRRPASHYSLGWFPRWAALASKFPRLVNALGSSALSKLPKRLAGVTAERPLPTFATQTFRDWFEKQNFSHPPQTRRVLLWVDTFTNYMAPEVGKAAVKVLHAAGYDVVIPQEKKLCCGITWVSTGQLDKARIVMQSTVEAIDPLLRERVPMVGLEPSCTALFRSDLIDLLGSNEQTRRVQENTFTFAEFLDQRAAHFELPKVEANSLTQTHCHQHAVMGFDAEERVMKRLGLNNSTLDSGCCGLAGNFGYEAEHYEVSVAVGEHEGGVLPKIRQADPTELILSDGFSCRTQISQLTERSPLHLAEVIAKAL